MTLWHTSEKETRVRSLIFKLFGIRVCASLVLSQFNNKKEKNEFSKKKKEKEARISKWWQEGGSLPIQSRFPVRFSTFSHEINNTWFGSLTFLEAPRFCNLDLYETMNEWIMKSTKWCYVPQTKPTKPSQPETHLLTAEIGQWRGSRSSQTPSFSSCSCYSVSCSATCAALGSIFLLSGLWVLWKFVPFWALASGVSSIRDSVEILVSGFSLIFKFYTL